MQVQCEGDYYPRVATMSLCGSSLRCYTDFQMADHHLILLIHLVPLKNAISSFKTTPLLSFSFKHVSSTLVSAYSDANRGSYPRAALMTVIQGCAAATIRG